MKLTTISPAVDEGPSNQSRLRLVVLMIPAVYPLITALLYIVGPAEVPEPA